MRENTLDSIEQYLITSENLDASTINQHVQAQGINWSENASEFYKRLMFNIKSFDEQLDQTYEVGIRLVNFGQNIQFAVRKIGYYNPKLITFSGVLEDCSKVQLIQHVNQISFLLLGVKRKETDKPKLPIGFSIDEEPCEQSGEKS